MSGSPTPLRSVLIVRLSAIGDVIHALPVLDALRRLLPSARIGWIVEELSAPLLDGHPDLDTRYVIPRRRWRGMSLARSFGSEVLPYFRRVREDRWDAVLDLQGLTKSGLVALGSGARLRVGFAGAESREANALLMTKRVPPPASARHVVERNLSLLRGLGLEPPAEARGRVHILPGEREAMAARLREAGWGGERLLGVNPGAGWASKRWPTDHFASAAEMLCRRHGLRPVVLWGPGEEVLRDGVLAGLAGVGGFAAPPTRIRELAVLTSMLSLFVGGDTGPTHLAATLDVPVVSVFGASDGDRNRPWPLAGAPMVQRRDLSCVPCWETRCPLRGAAHMACLSGIVPGEVADAAPKPREAGG